MSNDRGEDKRGPVRPTVIEGEAEEIAREDVSAEKDAAAEEAAERPDGEAGEKAGEDAAASGEDAADREADSAAAESSEKGKDAEAESASDTEAADDTATDTKLAEAAGQEEPAPKKRTGLKVLGVLALMGAAAGGGIYAYDQYGPGRELAALKAQVAALAEAKEKGPEALAAKINEKVALLAEKVAALSETVSALSGRVEGLEKKVADLAAAQEKLQAAPSAVPDALKQELAALKARLDELAQARAADAEKVQALEAAVKGVKAQAEAVAAALEKATAAAESAGAATGAPGEGGQPGAEGGQAGAAAAALQVAGLARKLAALEMKVAALEEGAAEAAGAVKPEALKGLEETLAQLKSELAALKTAAAQRDQRIDEALKAAETATARAEEALAAVQGLKEEAASRPAYTPPPVGAAFAALREKVQTGMPFADELKTLAGFLPDSPAVAELARVAEAGVPTAETLLAWLDEIAARHAAEKRKRLEAMAQEGIAGSLKARLMQVVKVRRKGEVDWAEVLAEAARAGHERGLAAALNVLGRVKGATPEDVAAWRQKAEARLAADAALAALAGDVVKAMTGEMPAGGEGAKGTSEQ